MNKLFCIQQFNLFCYRESTKVLLVYVLFFFQNIITISLLPRVGYYLIIIML